MTAFAVDDAVAVLARRQHGVFNRAQVLRAGGTRRIIDRRLERNRWLRLGPAVYALPSHPGTWHRAVLAAVLGEPDAVAGGRSAAVLHGLEGFRPGHPEIVVPADAYARTTLATVRRSSDLQRTVVDQIPVLTIADTMFALAGRVPAEVLEAALDGSLASGSLSIDRLQRRHIELLGSRRRGLSIMRSLIDVRSMDGFVPPESMLEGALYRILDGVGMPAYARQAPLPWAPDQRADALLLDAPVLVEADGRRWHTRLVDFERDRIRDRLAARHGHRTLRFTYAEIVAGPSIVADEVRVASRAAA